MNCHKGWEGRTRKDFPGGRKKGGKGRKVKSSMTNAYTCKRLRVTKAKMQEG